jgi:putative spermidine/putrescine transport system ATP-binding protein
VLRGKVADPEGGRIAIDGQEIIVARGMGDAKAGEIRSVALRPEAARLEKLNGTHNRMEGKIEEVSFLGAIVRIRVRFAHNAISLDTFTIRAPRRPSAASR